jgi:hypothetical protein
MHANCPDQESSLFKIPETRVRMHKSHQVIQYGRNISLRSGENILESQEIKLIG